MNAWDNAAACNPHTALRSKHALAVRFSVCKRALACLPCRAVEESLMSMEHPRVISAASFSPITGNAIMTTCGDNRLRIWDDASRADEVPSRELVHSHDFNRYLTPFKAVWDPKDTTERTVVIGRYAR
jgi:hypothetical protein